MVKPPLNHHKWAIFGTVDVRCQRSRATGHWRLRAPGLSDEDWRPGENKKLSWRISCGSHGYMALLYNIIIYYNILLYYIILYHIISYHIIHIIFMFYIFLLLYIILLYIIYCIILDIKLDCHLIILYLYYRILYLYFIIFCFISSY